MLNAATKAVNAFNAAFQKDPNSKEARTAANRALVAYQAVERAIAEGAIDSASVPQAKKNIEQMRAIVATFSARFPETPI